MEYLTNNKTLGARPLHAHQMLLVIAGCTKICWGLVLTLLLFARIIRVAAVEEKLHLPAFLFGILLLLWGVMYLNRVPHVSKRWADLSKASVYCTVLMIYFCPFVYWWKINIASYFLAFNMFGFCVSTILLLKILNHMVAEFALRMKDSIFRLEAQISAWGMVIMLGVPLIATLLYSISFIIRHHAHPFSQLQVHFDKLPTWSIAMMLMPFSITLINLWKIRRKCTQLLDTGED